jgi:penicillin-binding protein 1C
VSPVSGRCATDHFSEPPRISSPLRNVSYAVRRAASQEGIALEASTAADVRSVFWFDGSALIARRPAADGAFPWRPAAAGMHVIRIVDDHGRSAERDVEVRFVY